MASTYTSRIGLEKQGDGENANTWGLRLNQNVIELIDEAIAGYESIDLTSGAVSLTDTDGVLNEARNFGLKFTGTLSADTTVTIPAREKIYYVCNSTSGDFVVLLKPSGGTAVSVVESGFSMMAATDGSSINIIEGVNPSDYVTQVQVSALTSSLSNGDFVVGAAASAANADTLDGQQGSYYQNASNINAGTLSTSRLSGTYDISISGVAAIANNADLLDGLDSTAFLRLTASSLAQNGYIKFSNNLIIQWGRTTLGSGGGTITWPVAFTTAVYTAIGNDSTTQNGTSNMTSGGGTGLSLTGWNGDVGAGATYHWIAIGV
jgi:hypothetical protein